MQTSKYVYKRWYKRFAAGLFDLGGAVFASSRLSRPADLSHVKKILAIRLDHLGDVIMTRPALAALHKAFPDTAIDLLVSSEMAGLIKNDPWISEIIPVKDHWFSRQTTPAAVNLEKSRVLEEIKKRNYGLAVDFRGDLRIIHLMKQAGIPYRAGYGITGGCFWLTHTQPYDFQTHQVLTTAALLNALGMKSDVKPQRFYYSEEAKRGFFAKFPFLSSGLSDRIIVHTAAGYPSKEWGAAKFHELLTRLMKESPQTQVLFIGTEKEKAGFRFEENPRLIDLRGKTTLEELPILFDHAGFYIGNDSGPAHLAAAQGLPGVVIFSGTNLPSVWRPWSDKFKIVHRDIFCAPCEAKTCPLSHHDCMNLISVEQVYKAVITARASEVKK